jgi:hypothetical protein
VAEEGHDPRLVDRIHLGEALGRVARRPAAAVLWSTASPRASPTIAAYLHAPASPPITSMGWEVDPDGLHEVLLRLLRDYGPLPV